MQCFCEVGRAFLNVPPFGQGQTTTSMVDRPASWPLKVSDYHLWDKAENRIVVANLKFVIALGARSVRFRIMLRA